NPRPVAAEPQSAPAYPAVRCGSGSPGWRPHAAAAATRCPAVARPAGDCSGWCRYWAAGSPQVVGDWQTGEASAPDWAEAGPRRRGDPPAGGRRSAGAAGRSAWPDRPPRDCSVCWVAKIRADPRGSGRRGARQDWPDWPGTATDPGSVAWGWPGWPGRATGP